MKRFFKKEKGEVMIESTIVVTFVLLFLTVLIFLGLIVYQQTLISVMANQTASNVAQLYSNELKDPFTGYIDASSLSTQKVTQKMKDEAYKNVIKQKAEWFAKYRLKKYQFLDNEGIKVETDLIAKPNELMKSQIVVKVTADYSVPFVQLFNSDGKFSYSATGRADCFDLLDFATAATAITDKEIDVQDLTENYTVTFYVDNKEYAFAKVMQNTSIAQSASYMKTAKMPATPTATGAQFARWVKADDKTFDKDTVVSSNMKVNCEWKCKVTFDGNGGTVSGENPIYVVKGKAIGNLPTVNRNGYQFSCWLLNGTAIDKNYIVKSDITLKAEWKCTVTFNGNGGTVSGTNPKYVVKGSKIGAFPSVSRGIWTFDGWFIGNSKINTDYVVNNSLTVDAKWHCTHPSDYVTRTQTGRDCSHTYYHYKCNNCGYEWDGSDSNGNGGHIDARCGVQNHPLNPPYHLSQHAGTSQTTLFEHNVCLNCDYVYTVVVDGKTYVMHLCAQHRYKNSYGKWVYANDYTWDKKLPVHSIHGYTHGR